MKNFFDLTELKTVSVCQSWATALPTKCFSRGHSPSGSNTRNDFFARIAGTQPFVVGSSPFRVDKYGESLNQCGPRSLFKQRLINEIVTKTVQDNQRHTLSTVYAITEYYGGANCICTFTPSTINWVLEF